MVSLEETEVVEYMAEDPHPVAAHLGQGTVGVAVVHEPVIVGDTLRNSVDDAGCHECTGGGDPDHTVAADSPVAVRQTTDQLRGEVHIHTRVREDDEVVAGAVSLEEVECAHGARVYVAAPRVACAASVAVRSASPAGSAPEAAIQRIRGSRRNHARCRFA
jgi:hypothetical protein